MSIEKWLSEQESEEIQKQKEELFKQLPEEQKNSLKKKSIKKIVANDKLNLEIDITDKFLAKVIEFKEWLDGRTYLKGDIDKIITKLQILTKTLDKSEIDDDKVSHKEKVNMLNNLYKEIPPRFLDEKTRIALNKKLRATKRTNSDNYYLKKLKSVIKEKLNEAKYYEILRDILEI